MKIRYKYVQHERTEDAPFVGALICANDCNFNCKGCFNQDLRKERSHMDTAENIIKMVVSNPLNEGIILAGLEWTLDIKGMLEIIKEAVTHHLEIIIYTGCDFDTFTSVIGKYMAKKVHFDTSLSEKMLAGRDDEVYSIMGLSYLNDIIPYSYYIKTGLYDENKLVDDNIGFGVKLSSSNQSIVMIKGEDR